MGSGAEEVRCGMKILRRLLCRGDSVHAAVIDTEGRRRAHLSSGWQITPSISNTPLANGP